MSDEQYEEMMIAGHLPENLLNYEETTGAADTINKWVDEGHEIYIITGRPFNSYEPSRKWLDEHNLKEFHYTVLINMVVKPVNRTMHII